MLKNPILLAATLLGVPLLLLAPSFAQNAESAKEDPADFAKAVEAMADLGLPDLTGAQFVRLKGSEARGGYSQSYNNLDDTSLADAGWLLPAGEDGGKQILMGASTVEAAGEGSSGALGKLRKLLSGGKAGAKEDRVAWKEADIDKAFDKLEKHLDGQIKQVEKRVAQGFFDPSNISGGGRTFLFLVNAHRAGHGDVANRLLTKLMRAAGSAATPVEDATATMASTRYNKAMESLLAEGDWEAFDTSAREISALFGSTWRSAAAADLLLETIAPKLRGEPAPPVTGDGVTPELAAIAAKWAEGKLELGRLQSALWVLPGESDTPPEGALAEIVSAKMDAVPLLIALLDDRYPLLADNRLLGGGYNDMSYYYQRMGRTTPPGQVFAGMRRPLTRGDIAASMLRVVVPSGDDDLASRVVLDLHGNGGAPADPVAAMKTRAKAWYAAHADDSPQELAMHYFEEGSSSQRMTAIGVLAKGDSPEAFAMIEEFLIERVAENLYGDSLASTYLQARGRAGKDFLERYKKAALEATEQAELEYGEDVSKYIERELKNLEQFVDARDLEDLLAEVAAGNESLENLWQTLRRELAEMEDEEGELLLLKTAVMCENPADTVNLASSVVYLSSVRDPRLAAPEDTPEFDPESETAGYWKKLATDGRTTGHFPGTPKRTVAQLVAWVIDQKYSPGDARALRSYFHFDPDPAQDLVDRRSAARIAGEAILPAPDIGESGSDEEREKAWAAFAEIEPKAVPGTLASWPLAQKIALVRELTQRERERSAEGDGAEPVIGEQLAELGVRVSQVAPELAEIVAVGTKLDRAGVDRLLEKARALAVGDTPKVITIQRKALFGGIEIVLDGFPSDFSNCNPRVQTYVTHLASADEREKGGAFVGGVVGSDAYGSDSYTWPVEANTPEPPEEAASEEETEPEVEPGDDDDLLPDDSSSDDPFGLGGSGDDDYEREEFWEAADAIYSTEDGFGSALRLQFWAIPAATAADAADEVDPYGL